ncbi:MAG: hypothetical protein AUK44_04165 [Porphyromonadaceae bacterium CG2_30_38_12]|nr:MAG: hypothetical protein AUK44_04165 [Porphyromonadaceae bacterium CG2_30_38_12]
MPMQRITTSSKKTDLLATNKPFTETNNMQPSADTLKNILAFAAVYRVQKIAQNQYVEMYLN